LCLLDPVFTKIFTELVSPPNLNMEELSKATETFEAIYPHKNFTEFIATYQAKKAADDVLFSHYTDPDTAPSSRICPRMAFDPLKRNFVSPIVIPARRRRKKEEFDVYKFFVEKDQNGEGIPLTIIPSVDDEDYFDMSHEEKNREDAIAGTRLRKIASLVTTLNTACSYRILDLHSERRIH
ncbi:uncharacterized protein CDAR_405941, partial [Caerostris darwini]